MGVMRLTRRTRESMCGCIYKGAHIATMPATCSCAAAWRHSAPPNECPMRNTRSQLCLSNCNSCLTAVAHSGQHKGSISLTCVPCPGKRIFLVMMSVDARCVASSSMTRLLPLKPWTNKTPSTDYEGLTSVVRVRCSSLFKGICDVSIIRVFPFVQSGTYHLLCISLYHIIFKEVILLCKSRMRGYWE